MSDSNDKKTFNSATFSASADSTGSILYTALETSTIPYSHITENLWVTPTTIKLISISADRVRYATESMSNDSARQLDSQPNITDTDP